ncbi:MAG: glycosyltransferase family 2 protein [Betaproteobacteria bacterium]|nr:glycosyltransferase family 2 protein [Betaproteobacteria bacterium]
MESPFSVVVVNFNGGSMLVACVESVLGAKIAAQRVVLVDNGSQDASVGQLTARYPYVQVIRNDCNAGFARAANQGLALVQTPFAILLNNDAMLTGAAITALEAAFGEDPLLAIAGGALFYPDGRPQRSEAALPRWAMEILPRPLRSSSASGVTFGMKDSTWCRYAESTIGAMFALRLSAFHDLGGFDEDYFFFLEETDLCKRAWSKGFHIAMVDAAQIVHRQGATAKRYAAARIEYQRSKLIYFRKHAGLAAYYSLCVLFPLKALIRSVGAAAACAASLALSSNARLKLKHELRVLLWYALGRPESWGLPGKCARNR